MGLLQQLVSSSSQGVNHRDDGRCRRCMVIEKKNAVDAKDLM